MTKLRLKRPEPPSSENSAPELSHGILTEWNDERGYGFITPDTGEQKVFLHMKSLLSSARRPARGEIFFYKLTVDGSGRDVRGPNRLSRRIWTKNASSPSCIPSSGALPVFAHLPSSPQLPSPPKPAVSYWA